MFSFKDNGILIVVVDACIGTVSGKRLFSGVDLKHVDGYLTSGIPQRYVYFRYVVWAVALLSNKDLNGTYTWELKVSKAYIYVEGKGET